MLLPKQTPELLLEAMNSRIRIYFKVRNVFLSFPSIPLTCPFDMGGSKIKCRLLKLV